MPDLTQTEVNERVAQHELWLDNPSTGYPLVLTNSDLRNLGFQNKLLNKAIFDGSDLSGANFSDSACTQASFKSVYCHKANLIRTSFHKADMECSIFTTSFFVKSNLTGANLQGADLWDATFRGAKLLETSLTDTKLQGADFSHANLTHTNLKHANLTETILTNTFHFQPLFLFDHASFEQAFLPDEFQWLKKIPFPKRKDFMDHNPSFWNIYLENPVRFTHLTHQVYELYKKAETL